LVGKPKIKYTHGDKAGLNEIEALWGALNQYHCQRSAFFKEHYCRMTFEKRKAGLLKKAAGGELRVDLAVDEAAGKAVGYVVSTVNFEKIGEVESVFVCEGYRGMGVGGSLMKNALSWMGHIGALEKVVEVSIGNEVAFGFYRRYGFLPRKTVLKQAKEDLCKP
jgi:ribosomal protein S18 acetylase RimI-like enzyme